MLSQIHTLLQQIPANGADGIRYFNRPLTVALGPFQSFDVWAACPAPDGAVYVMDADQAWHPLEDNASDRPVIEAIFKKLDDAVDWKRREVA